MKILITGATGLIGKELGKALAFQNHDLVVISRDRDKARRECPFPCKIVEGDLTKSALTSPLLNEIGVVFHLMGEPVAEGRWTDEKKKALIDSRVRSTANLRESLGSSVKTVIAASATGYYGDRGDEELTEESAPGPDFLADLCVAWESEVAKFQARTVFVRTGLVITRQDGILKELMMPFRAGVGGPIAGGQAWMSWIHLRDVVGIYIHALNTENLTGAVNAVGPKPVRNIEFTRVLAQALGKPATIPLPAIAVKALFGQKAEIITASQKVLPKAAEKTGYQFLFTALQDAIKEETKGLREGEDLLVSEHYIPLPPEKLFPFFSDAKNLEEITPETLSFQIVGQSTEELKEGTLIDYRLKIHGVPVGWQTRIDEWQPPKKFVDRQLKGPYEIWHHTHEFRALAEGTLMTDRVRYKLPLGYLGWLGAGSFVAKDVAGIFNHRREVIDRLFSVPPK